MMGSFSIWHWLIVLVIIVVVFGTKKLRNMGGDLGGAVKGFKQGMKDDGEEKVLPLSQGVSMSKSVLDGLPLCPEEIERAWRAGDYDAARAALQKHAYGMLGASEDDKQIFRQVVTEFAKDDPLYQEIMAKIKPLVLSHPGILQSTIYQELPEYDQETIRYVAYFGHEIGDIHRRKKGRSYELLPPGTVIDA